MTTYSKEFLINAFMHRYLQCKLISVEALVQLEEMAVKFYDEVGRDKFRTYASLDAERIREYKNLA